MEFWDDQLAKEFRWFAKEEAEKVKRELTKKLEEAEAETERIQKRRDNGIVHLIQTGVPLQLLADSFRLTMEEVRQIAREHGIDPVEG